MPPFPPLLVFPIPPLYCLFRRCLPAVVGVVTNNELSFRPGARLHMTESPICAKCSTAWCIAHSCLNCALRACGTNTQCSGLRLHVRASLRSTCASRARENQSDLLLCASQPNCYNRIAVFTQRYSPSSSYKATAYKAYNQLFIERIALAKARSTR